MTTLDIGNIDWARYEQRVQEVMDRLEIDHSDAEAIVDAQLLQERREMMA